MNQGKESITITSARAGTIDAVQEAFAAISCHVLLLDKHHEQSSQAPKAA